MLSNNTMCFLYTGTGKRKMRLSKYALILAGLLSSAGAMAAATPGGTPTGTVNIDGVIRTSSCSIGTPSTTDVGFNISKVDINAAAANGLIAQDLTPVTIHVTSCKDTALGMTVTAGNPDATKVTHGLFDSSQDPDTALYYVVGLKDDPTVTGGDTATAPGYHIVQVDGKSSASDPITIKDSSGGTGEFDVTLQTMVGRNGSTSADNLASKLSTSYTYTFTYA
ncbi:hypothetical protein ABVL59_004745 [Salmonella enterica]|nr:hypothetical protein [Salmonella enterica]ECE3476027.1 hypothetical protein [Salmonella enterica]EDJ5368005.1 hypothetical protein [Salmonella enterica]EEF3822569.1 hypothetical protein [Salmonella enterica]EHE1081299.1 hypothetical protein [Salmonella enterica]